MGRKVSIRYALAGDPEHPFSEAIGVISSVGESDQLVITIVDRAGGSVEVAASDVLQGKVFPL